MKKNLIFFSILFVSLIFTSCLKSGLDDIPTYSSAEITNFQFEYRWMEDVNGNNQLKVQPLTTTSVINATKDTISCAITVPAVSATFPVATRDKVVQSNIVGYANISNAASIKPLSGAPVLGAVGDFSATNMQYEVTAADGTKKVWNLKISKFTK